LPHQASPSARGSSSSPECFALMNILHTEFHTQSSRLLAKTVLSFNPCDPAVVS
jgi:hypothetical protein